MGRVRAILQGIHAPRLVPVEPLVSCLAANFEAPTDLGYAPFLALAFFDELQALIHHRTLHPAHTSLFGDRRKSVNPLWGMFCYQSHRRACYHSSRSVPFVAHALVRAAFTLSRNPPLLASCGLRRNQLKSKLLGASGEGSDLLLAIFSLVVFGPLVDVLLSVLVQPVKQTGQLAGHGSDRPGRAESGTESSVLRSQVALTA